MPDFNARGFANAYVADLQSALTNLDMDAIDDFVAAVEQGRAGRT